MFHPLAEVTDTQASAENHEQGARALREQNHSECQQVPVRLRHLRTSRKPPQCSENRRKLANIGEH